ncbi:MAG: sirohydrochlorin cobaltochelatase [Halanaerobiales bacterium]|nr:sirohydrochlorin cobaltochelatase [Halanaerobiales bacterium]
MKKGILVVSFGTSYEETRKRCIESIEEKVKETFKEYEVRRAFTSNMIIKKLKERDGLHIDTTMDALNRMVEDGFKEIIVQPLHIIPGLEYEKVKLAVAMIKHKKEINITLGHPLLYSIEDYHEVIEALEHQMPTRDHEHAVVLMGHGTEHFANACYSLLQRLFDDKKSHVFIGNVEGYPELKDLLPILKERDYKKLTLMPMMLVAGDHAQNDMAGDEEDSWKSVLESEGFEVECVLKGLGENELIGTTFVNRINVYK